MGNAEDGVDEDGLSKELFTLYWKDIFAKDPSSDDGKVAKIPFGLEGAAVPLFTSASRGSDVFIPKPHDHTTCGQGKEPCAFFNIGRMLLKSIGTLH